MMMTKIITIMKDIMNTMKMVVIMKSMNIMSMGSIMKDIMRDIIKRASTPTRGAEAIFKNYQFFK
jgi:hypothetical protein